jgi:hypothetical protein
MFVRARAGAAPASSAQPAMRAGKIVRRIEVQLLAAARGCEVTARMSSI